MTHFHKTQNGNKRLWKFQSENFHTKTFELFKYTFYSIIFKWRRNTKKNEEGWLSTWFVCSYYSINLSIYIIYRVTKYPIYIVSNHIRGFSAWIITTNTSTNYLMNGMIVSLDSSMCTFLDLIVLYSIYIVQLVTL